jgi:copper chaperone
MTTKTFQVPNISCGHCTHTIETEIGELAGVDKVKAEVESKRVTVEWHEPATWAQIESLLEEIDFPPAA